MKALLPDGTELQLDDGATGADAAAAIGAGLARAALAVKVDGQLRDLTAPLHDGATLEILTQKSGEEALELLRHDTAHVLAAAVIDLYPGVKISIGPPIQDGFYYDFEFPPGVTVSDADFARIEAKMKEHIKADEQFAREDVSVGTALERFVREQQPYKVELIEDLVRNAPADDPVETVSLYTNGPFTDLCRGPHGPGTKRIKAFKLQSIAGAYWRGDARRTMLTRIYGTAFFTKEELAAYLERVEEAKKRDHRKLGRELRLFGFSAVAPGSAFWLPRGTQLWNTLVAFTRELNRPRGYDEVKTPQIYDSELWKTSGHWGKYKENMFLTAAEDRDMAVKPMNCPGHCQLFGMQRHSHRELPVRYSEPGLLHRYEPSGTLHGLMRVRHFAQDDAHIFCTEEQVQDEVIGCLDLIFETLGRFGFDIDIELSTRPENRIGSEEMWDRAEAKLADALRHQGLEYRINEGDGAFYGPKIDFHVTDSLGRSWQLGTVQLDYSMPARFGLTYVGADDREHTPVMIHRAAMGSYERFIGMLIEHYAGEFPVWLSPVQAIVLPISDRHVDYAQEVVAALQAAGVRVDVDERTESVGRKIRDAELQKYPYMLILGDREAEGREVAARRHREGDIGSFALTDFVARVAEETATRSA
ncbi:threonine--tRNA ligase [Conexibacter sp. JD483]|uniref:threonine--tRNA ligase n=1 Tax=unclassified Conexibacter TaxID=2627773 RepID=UPI002718DDC4|nr:MULTISPECIES: threonine--tRNA ligase [unclassified Conexibacter]MDO8185706.1 threonine--tRNA ligase [Conexibacter sp. CPCC 205706]MDO8199083.1 threonine--tRNA ligase [Conexibacter sp. CPCC 205762]MDR9370498.1 threonine--tRNA ligase [Conexibacter sp. JD483]